MNIEDMVKAIHWLGHAAFRIETGKGIIYIDPYHLKQTDLPADIILITHEHYDHCSVDDVKKIHKKDTVIIGPESVARKLSCPVKTIRPGGKIDLKDIAVEAVYAYNLNKPFHPKSPDFLGYILTLEGVRIYHAGDTDVIPEMGSIVADIALLPIGGTYTMGPAEAATAADKMKPAFIIPMHWGSVVGGPKEVEQFRKLAAGKAVVRDPAP
jgi:L-ascorbate metabolism protein UlaG (beta-lactamase superfamily)